MKTLIIQWVDSNSTFGWHSEDERPDVVYITSSGYAVHDDDAQIVLAQSVDIANDRYHNTIAIPRACIKDIKEIVESEGKGVKCRYGCFLCKATAQDLLDGCCRFCIHKPDSIRMVGDTDSLRDYTNTTINEVDNGTRQGDR